MTDRRKRVWRKRGEDRYQKALVQEKLAFGGGSVLVWGAIWHGGRSTLLQIEGTVTAEVYRGVLEWFFRSHDLPENAIFQDDNAPPHRARIVEMFLQHHEIQTLQWPPCSPDLNPIEHMWDFIGRRVAALELAPQSLEDLSRAVQDAWQSIPQNYVDNLVCSMTRRVGEV